MTSVVNPLPIPKRKRFAHRQKNPFLPLTVSSSSSTGIVWRHFTGYLVGQWVAVFHRGDAEALANANFGKGVLSKFGVAFEGRDWKPIEIPNADVPGVENELENEQLHSPTSDCYQDVEDEGEADQEETDVDPTESQPQRQAVGMQLTKFKMAARRYSKHVEWKSAVQSAEEAVDDCFLPVGSDSGPLIKTDASELEPPCKKSRLDDNVAEEREEEEEEDHEHDAEDGSADSDDSGMSKSEASKFSKDYLICEDSDPEEEFAPPRVLFSCDEDPLPLRECLLLSPEEAFFLSYGLGCLTVISSSPFNKSSSETDDSEATLLPLLELWRRFRDLDPCFHAKYVAYHYYRSRGWVPRCGLKFGVDFLLYVSGPAHYHATFSVVVEEMTNDMEKVSTRRETSYAPSASGLSRVTEQVNKDLLICNVVQPKRDSFEELESFLSSPNCVREFCVKEILKKRWITDTERDQTKGVLLSM